MTKSVDRPNDEAGEAGHAASVRGDATRRAIVDATIELIGEVGWAGVTTRLVARRANVTQGVIHYHFGSKDALLRVAVITAFSEMLSAPAEALASAGSISEGLTAVIGSLAALGEAPLLSVSAEALSLALRDRQLGEWMRQALVEFRGMIAQGLRDATPPGDRDDERIDGTAVLLAALLDGLLLHRAVDPELDLSAASAALTSLIGTEEANG